MINEVAWMGAYSYEGETASSAAKNEWLELFSDTAMNLEGWTLSAKDGEMTIMLMGSISAGGYYVLERTDDSTVSGITADFIYGNDGSGWSLSNSGEILILKDLDGNEIDRVDGSDNWKINGSEEIFGNNTSKETMQKSGSGWITAPATPKAENAETEQSEEDDTTDNEDEPEEETQQQEEKVVQAGFIEKKQFRADAGDDAVAIVGVEKLFEGKGYDLDGDPLEKGDFLWTFGDGGSARGKNVRHTFLYPGEYRVVFDVSSGVYNASDMITATVTPLPLSITEVKPGTEGFIELRNDSAYELDISYWGIGNGNLAYYFPQATHILPYLHLVIPYAISHIEFYSFGESLMYYPDGRVVDMMQYGGVTKDDESFHNINQSARLGIASPGSERFVARVAPSTVLNYESGVKNYGTVAGVQENNDIKNDAVEEIYKETDHTDRQIASVVPSGKSLYQHQWFWFAVIFIFALASAFAVFLQKRYSS
ncbi:MAG: PKD domain-containing protein [bacterium]|nr:PKD domain-containing protein [bacterium]